MKLYKKWYFLVSMLSCCLLVFCFSSSKKVSNTDDYETILKRVQEILTWRHFYPKEVNDDFSTNVFNRYVLSLDPSKRLFYQSDIDAFKKESKSLDESFIEGDLTFYKSTIDSLYNRTTQQELLVEKLLKEPFDYNEEDYIVFDDNDLQYAKTDSEMEKRWVSYLKYNILQEINSLKEEDEHKEKLFGELESLGREEVRDYISEFFRRFKKREKKDWLSLYINSHTEEYDPHTSYFSPKEKEDFDFSISGQLEGIGARLQDKRGYATILELIIGGPAWKSGEIEVGDQIIKVAQGKNGKPVNIVGLLLDDAIRLIRGKKGSIVILTIKKKDGSSVDVEIERDVIEYNDAFARSAVILGKDGKKYGVILLPEFYANFKDENGSDASNDILYQITELKKENISGLIFDVRNNGGGSLQEVVEIAGFFIKKGPIVQVKSNGQKKDIHEDKDPSIYWDGPLVILVNELSASASEILAAALKDYNRAVVIGGNKTYGKGTVQTVYPLNSFFNKNKDYGALKLTIQKFYRINGESTQLKGVESDIVIPGKYTYADLSESEQVNALKWDEIESVPFDKNSLNINKIKRKSQARLSNNGYVSLLNKSALLFKEMSNKKRIPLRYEDYNKEIALRKEKVKKMDSLLIYNNKLKASYPSYEQALIKNDTVLKAKRENWHKDLEKDFHLEEAISVLKDL